MKALVFDYDGLIVDTEYPEYLSWKEVYQDAGVDLAEEIWTTAVGSVDAFHPRTYLERLTGRAFDWAEIEQKRRQKLIVQQNQQPLLPGVARLMLRAREAGYRIGVASNSTAEWVENGLKRLGIRHFIETVRTVDTVQSPKPHPEIYLRALQDLQIEAKDAMAFEDSHPGVCAAKGAGLQVVAIPSRLTRFHDLSLADQIIESLDLFVLPAWGR